MDWTLHLDETGDFSGQEDVVVLGVLVQDTLGMRAEAMVRAALGAHYPWLNWPPHQRILRHAGAQLTRVKTNPSAAEGHVLGELLLAYLRQLGDERPQGWDVAVESWRENQEPRWEVLKTLRRSFHSGGHATSYIDIERRLEEHWRSFLRDVATALGEACLEGMVVLAGAQAPRPAVPSDQGDPYLALLVHAVRRAVSVLLAQGGPPARLSVSPLQRRVRHPVLGTEAHMDQGILRSVIHEAVGPTGVARHRECEVVLQPGALFGFHQQGLPLGYVLADLLAPAAKSCARRPKSPWLDVSAGFRLGTGFSLDDTEHGLPLLAATGGAASPMYWLDKHPRLQRLGAGWAVEQASRWDAFMAGKEDP